MTNGAPNGQVIELTSGMNYWDGTRWALSEAVFEPSDDSEAFVARRVHHKTRLSADLNTAGAVSIMIGNDLLRLSPVAVALFDAVSGRFQIIAVITNSVGVQTETNRVEYPNCFSGVCAGIAYTIERGSFRQDVIFTGNVDPQAWNFPTNSTRIQLISEFFDGGDPERLRRPLYVEQDPAVRSRSVTPDLMDEQLRFGELLFCPGQARSDAAGSEERAIVAKEFHIDAQSGRRFLVESMPYDAVRKMMRSLPNCPPAGQASIEQGFGSSYAGLPQPSANSETLVARKASALQIARGMSLIPAGVVADFVVTIGPGYPTPAVFRGDTTYFVSGPVSLNNCTTEGGAVFKYPNSTGANTTTAYLQVNGTLTTKTMDYRPAIFTSGDDETAGMTLGTELLSGQGAFIWANWHSVTTPPNNLYGAITPGTYYANPALLLNYASASPSNMRFMYCQEAIRFVGSYSSSYVLSHSQFVNCLRGINLQAGSGSGSGSSTFLTANNNLMSKVLFPITTGLTFPYAPSLTHCTIDGKVDPTTKFVAAGTSV